MAVIPNIKNQFLDDYEKSVSKYRGPTSNNPFPSAPATSKAAEDGKVEDAEIIKGLAGQGGKKNKKGKGQIAGLQDTAPAPPSPAKPTNTSRYLPPGTTDPGDLKPDPLRFTNAVDKEMGYNVASDHGGHYIDEGEHKGKSPGRAYNDIKKRVDSTVTGSTQTATVDANGQIASTGTNKQIEGSNLYDRGTADVRRGRMAQDSDNRYNRAAAAVRARKQEMQNDRERDNLEIEDRGYSTKDGVTRFYNDADRIAAGNSARDSDAAQKMAASGGDMNKARELAKGSMGNDRSGAQSSAGRATAVQIDPKYVPRGAPAIGIGGVSLVDNKASDSQTGSGIGMGLDEAKSLAGLPDMKGMASAGQMDARDRVGASINDTMRDQIQKSGGIAGISSPEARQLQKDFDGSSPVGPASAPQPTKPKSSIPQLVDSSSTPGSFGPSMSADDMNREVPPRVPASVKPPAGTSFDSDGNASAPSPNDYAPPQPAIGSTIGGPPQSNRGSSGPLPANDANYGPPMSIPGIAQTDSKKPANRGRGRQIGEKSPPSSINWKRGFFGTGF